MPGLKGKPYKDCLKTLELPSLLYKNKQGDIIQMFKMKAKIENLPFDKFFRKTAIHQTRGHSEKVYKPEARKTYLCKLFLSASSQYMEQPAWTYHRTPNINSFKNRIDRSWEKHNNKFNTFAEWST